MMKKINKKYNRAFSPHENKTTCFIHVDNVEVAVNIVRENQVVTMDFSLNGKIHTSKIIELKDRNDRVSLDLTRISFNSIDINEIDKANLADCIDEMIDWLYA